MSLENYFNSRTRELHVLQLDDQIHLIDNFGAVIRRAIASTAPGPAASPGQRSQQRHRKSSCCIHLLPFATFAQFRIFTASARAAVTAPIRAPKGTLGIFVQHDESE